MYQRDSDSWLKHWDFILLDLICLQVAFVLAFAISGYGFNPYEQVLYRNMAFFIELADFVGILLLGTMCGVLKRGPYRELAITVEQAFVVGAAAIFYLFMLQQGQLYSRLALVLTFVLYVVLSYTTRMLWKYFLKRRMVEGGHRSLLIVTASDIASEVVKRFIDNNYAGFKIVGIAVVDKDMVGSIIEGIDVVAGKDSLLSFVCQEWVDEVLIVPSEGVVYPRKMVEQIAETGVVVHYSLAQDMYIPERRQFIEYVGDLAVVTTSMNYASAKQLFAKRAIDIAVGFVGCICTGIIFVFVAPAIYIQSPGPIFYSQERAGKNGRRFKMYKFRSMYLDADERKADLMAENKIQDDRMFKLDFDPRVIGNRTLSDGTKKTGIGDFIRRTSLDEFPQFFNVLKGDMSVVGTRPPIIAETNLYESHHRARLAIKPGITGLWQVSGRSNITDFEEVVALDKAYINNWSLKLDIKILLKTIVIVLKGEGSA